MKTRPCVKLRLPFSFYDTARLEQWLERMGIMENGRLTDRAGDPTLFTTRR